jgi:hypothetical protein
MAAGAGRPPQLAGRAVEGATAGNDGAEDGGGAGGARQAFAAVDGEDVLGARLAQVDQLAAGLPVDGPLCRAILQPQLHAIRLRERGCIILPFAVYCLLEIGVMPKSQWRTKEATSMRLSREAKQLLTLLAERGGISQAAMVETLIRERARREKVVIADPEAKLTAREQFLALLEQAHSNDPGDLTPEELEREVTLAHEETREILRARRH